MKVEYFAYFFTLLLFFVKPCPSESTKKETKLSKLLRYFVSKKFTYKILQNLLQKDIDNPIWEKKYGNMSKVYIKIFKRRKFRWQQKLNLKKDGEKIVEALKENGFDPDLETKIITHGYIDSGITFHNSFAEAYENRGKNNKKFTDDLDLYNIQKSIKNFLYQLLKKVGIFLIRDHLSIT